MKLLLCSAGFSTPDIVTACVQLVGKPREDIRVGIINEAYAVEAGDKRWLLNDLRAIADNFPAEMEMVNLLALSKDEVATRLTHADVIIVEGGHTDYLMSVFQKTGFDRLLPKLLQTKVYVGSSAGSMVVGKRISTAAYKAIYNEDGSYGIIDYLNLVDFSVMPHLDSPYFANRREMLTKTATAFDGTIYGLRDDTALVVDGKTMRVIGSQPLVIKNGALQNQ